LGEEGRRLVGGRFSPGFYTYAKESNAVRDIDEKLSPSLHLVPAILYPHMSWSKPRGTKVKKILLHPMAVVDAG
jgi:hypothetical protein